MAYEKPTISLENPEFRVSKLGSSVYMEISDRENIVEIEMSKWDFTNKKRSVSEVTFGNLTYAITAINEYRGKNPLDLIKEISEDYLTAHEEHELMEWLHQKHFAFRKI